MAEIPYFFETPVPKYFRESGWFKNPKTRLFVMWAFERCSLDRREIFHDGKKILLEPYQFIFGRKICSDELGMTEGEVRNQVKSLYDGGLLKNATKSTTKRYSVYEWSTTCFSKTNNQVNNQITTKSQPSNNHNNKNIRKKKEEEDHHPSPSSSDPEDDDDDFFSKSKKREEEALDKTEIYEGVFLNQHELAECIRIKGSIEKVREAVAFVMNSPKRQFSISNWPQTLSTWHISENKPKVSMEENLNLVIKLSQEFSDPKKAFGWTCRAYFDKIKDQKGLLFENESPYKKSIFIALSDGKFEEKCSDAIKINNMRK